MRKTRTRVLFKILRAWNLNWLITRSTPVKRPKGFVVVTGCYNSGTTLLYRILQMHPAVSGIPPLAEGDVFVREFTKAENYGWRRMWHRCEDQVRRTGCHPRLARSVLRQWRWWISPDMYFAEKSVCDMLRLDFFRQSFSALGIPPKFVLIVRHPLPVVEGILRRASPMSVVAAEFKGEGYPPEMALEQWKASARITVEQMKYSDVYVIRYEDLCNSPKETLEQLFQKLGLQMECLDIFDGEIRGQGASIRVQNMNRLSENRFPIESWQTLMNADDGLPALMGKFGYAEDMKGGGD